MFIWYVENYEDFIKYYIHAVSWELFMIYNSIAEYRKAFK